MVSLIKLQQFSKHLRLRESTPSRRGKIHSFQKNLFKYPGLSAGTGKLCIFGHLGLVFIWSCFVSRLLFLLYYVICAPVLTEGTKYPRLLSWASGQEISFVRDSLLIEEEACANNLQYKVALHLRKAKTFYLLDVKTTKMASQDYF